MKMIAFISCVKSKKDTKDKAKYLYISDFFKKSLAYAELYYDEVYILSAKYGLVNLNDVIEPYEKTLKNMSYNERLVWAMRVARGIMNRIVNRTDNKEVRFVFVCGQVYQKELVPILKTKGFKCYTPLKNVGGIGKQLSFFKRKVEEFFK